MKNTRKISNEISGCECYSFSYDTTSLYIGFTKEKAGRLGVHKKEKDKMKDAEDIDISHLAGVYKEIAEEMGRDTAFKMYVYFRGQQITFPTRFYDVNYLAELIREDHAEGRTMRELSKQYGYTERRIRQILQDCGEEELRSNE